MCVSVCPCLHLYTSVSQRMPLYMPVCMPVYVTVGQYVTILRRLFPYLIKPVIVPFIY